MGLLDDLLAGLAGQGRSGSAQPQSRQASAGPGMNQVLMALMPIVLGMLANRSGRSGSPRLQVSGVSPMLPFGCQPDQTH